MAALMQVTLYCACIEETVSNVDDEWPENELSVHPLPREFQLLMSRHVWSFRATPRIPPLLALFSDDRPALGMRTPDYESSFVSNWDRKSISGWCSYVTNRAWLLVSEAEFTQVSLVIRIDVVELLLSERTKECLFGRPTEPTRFHLICLVWQNKDTNYCAKSL